MKPPNGKSFLVGLSWLLIAPQLAGALNPPACSAAVRFDLNSMAPIAPGLQGKLILRPAKADREVLTLKARVGAPVTAELPCSSQWEATADFPDVWGPRVKVTAGSAGTTVASSIALWPLGKIAGSTKVLEKDQHQPKMLSVTTLAARTTAQREVPKGFLECPIDTQGKWLCPPVPAATFDFVLSAEGFIPQYRWGLKVVAGKTADLGTVELKRGASVAGWVEVEQGPIDPACRARLTPLMGAGAGAKIADKVRSTTTEVPVRKDGFFQFVGVAPGNYSLEASQPGFAVARISPVQVSPRTETFVRQPVTLKRPLQMELAIAPALDWLGHPWKVLVFRDAYASSGFDADAIFNGASNEQGLVAIRGQAPGRFRVSVADSLNNQLFSQELEITGPEDAHHTIDLNLLTIRGTVELGKEPLAATLWFGGRYGSTAIKMESDRDGKFHGILPRAGWWRIEISATDPKFETRAKTKVEADSLARARVDISLPATRVYGKVVDERGMPAPSSTVGLSTDDNSMESSSDDTGTFEFRGLSPGMAYAAASRSSAQGDSTSDRLSLLIRDGEDVGPLELRLHKNKKISGTVQSARGPVPGAGIYVLPLLPTVMFGDSVRADLDGGFTAQVPAATVTADVIVSAPGFALKAFPASVGEAAQSLTVGEGGGNLELLFPEKPKDAEKDEVSLWIFQDGLPLPPNVLYQWARGQGYTIAAQGKKLVFPALASGEYRVCLAAQALLVPWQASGFAAPLAKCVSGELPTGGTLKLDLSQP